MAPNWSHQQIGPQSDVIFVHILVRHILSTQLSSSLLDGIEDFVIPALIQCAVQCSAVQCSTVQCSAVQRVQQTVQSVYTVHIHCTLHRGAKIQSFPVSDASSRQPVDPLKKPLIFTSPAGRVFGPLEIALAKYNLGAFWRIISPAPDGHSSSDTISFYLPNPALHPVRGPAVQCTAECTAHSAM
jgi:hypothetical protein